VLLQSCRSRSASLSVYSKISQEMLKERTGFSKNVISRSVKQLEESRFIECSRDQRRKYKQFGVNEYFWVLYMESRYQLGIPVKVNIDPERLWTAVGAKRRWRDDCARSARTENMEWEMGIESATQGLSKHGWQPKYMEGSGSSR
jgi:hypothetical protein